jgi:hypothetical protein
MGSNGASRSGFLGVSGGICGLEATQTVPRETPNGSCFTWNTVVG